MRYNGSMPTKSPHPKVVDLKHPETARIERRREDIEAAVARALPAQLIEWETVEYDHTPKDQRWFVIGGIVAAIFFFYAIFTANYFFALFVLLATFVVFLYARRAPQPLICSVTSHGIYLGRSLYEFDHLHSFWIFYHADGIKHLSLHSKRAMIPFVRVPLGQVDPV